MGGHTVDQKSENLIVNVNEDDIFAEYSGFFCFTSREECAPKPREETKTGENKIKLRQPDKESKQNRQKI